MSSTPVRDISIEQLGFALDALGWRVGLDNPEAPTRAAMLGTLLFVVVSELQSLDDPAEDADMLVGYGSGIGSVVRATTTTEEQFARGCNYVVMTLLESRVRRVGAAAKQALSVLDETFGTAQIVESLALALEQFMRVPTAFDPVTKMNSYSPADIKRSLSAARPHLAVARQQLEAVRRKVKQS